MTSQLALIVAMTEDGIIGRNGRLPWPMNRTDMQHFRKLTLGHAVIMGRKTHESIGKPLKDRRNIVVTRDVSASFDGCEMAHSLGEAISKARETDDYPFVIGGAQVYAEALPLATRMFITIMRGEYSGDAKFPSFDESQWRTECTATYPLKEGDCYMLQMTRIAH